MRGSFPPSKFGIQISAKNVIEAIDKDKYEPILIGVDKKGKWLLADSSKFLLNSGNLKLIKLNNETSQNIALVPQFHIY